jgi:hypothetical protein
MTAKDALDAANDAEPGERLHAVPWVQQRLLCVSRVVSRSAAGRRIMSASRL